MATNDEPTEDKNHSTEEEENSDNADEQVKQTDVKKEGTDQPAAGSLTNNVEEDEDLEEGELKDDEDDDDDDVNGDDENAQVNDGDVLGDSKRLTGYNNNNDNNIRGLSKESSYNDKRNDQHHHAIHQQQQNYPTHQSASGQPPSHSYHNNPNRHLSPNSQQLAELHNQYPTNHHHFSSNNNHYRYPPNDGPPPPMNHHPQAGPPAAMFPRGGMGGPGGVPPMHKGNVRCRFYSKTSNKCTWGDHCRFEHRDDSPGPEFDNRPPLGPGRGPMPPMGAAERGQYPHYGGRHQPYPPPPPPPHGYPYDAYGYHHSTPPPPPLPHSMSHWRQQHSPYPSPSLGHPPESVSPALLPTPGSGSQLGTSSSSTGGRGPPPPPGSSGGSGSSGGGNALPIGGAPSPGYPSPSSSAVVYERKHRLAYELAPWNDRGYPPPSKYDRGDPAGGYSNSRAFYRNHYSREPPYGREPMPHMSGAPHPGGYPNYPSAYRGGSMGPHASHFKFMSSSQRTVPPDARRSRSNKRGHDEDESSWSDSGSEDSILGQANYGSKNHVSKISKQLPPDNLASDEPLDQGSGTPPGEPSPEDRERQEMLLNKLKEIEDLMAKKKGEQEDQL